MKLTGIQFGMLAAFSILLASGQVLFKHSALSSPPLNTLSALLSLLRIPSFWAAVVLYGLGTLLWIFLLQQVSLSRAYPFVALGFVIVPLAGQFLFSEYVPKMYWLGVLLIICGILLTGLKTK